MKWFFSPSTSSKFFELNDFCVHIANDGHGTLKLLLFEIQKWNELTKQGKRFGLLYNLFEKKKTVFFEVDGGGGEGEGVLTILWNDESSIFSFDRRIMVIEWVWRKIGDTFFQNFIPWSSSLKWWIGKIRFWRFDSSCSIHLCQCLLGLPHPENSNHHPLPVRYSNPASLHSYSNPSTVHRALTCPPGLCRPGVDGCPPESLWAKKSSRRDWWKGNETFDRTWAGAVNG